MYSIHILKNLGDYFSCSVGSDVTFNMHHINLAWILNQTLYSNTTELYAKGFDMIHSYVTVTTKDIVQVKGRSESKYDYRQDIVTVAILGDLNYITLYVLLRWEFVKATLEIVEMKDKRNS